MGALGETDACLTWTIIGMIPWTEYWDVEVTIGSPQVAYRDQPLTIHPVVYLLYSGPL